MTNRLHQFQQSGNAPHGVDPADYNLDPQWGKDMAKIGMAILIVQVLPCDKFYQDTTFYEALGEKLHAASLGHFDCASWQPRVRFFFYVSEEKLSAALTLVKSDIEQRGFLGNACIGHFDSQDNFWRVFYPEMQEGGA